MPDPERDRLARTYESYLRSAAKQKAWNAENPGNQQIRSELQVAVHEAVGSSLPIARRVLDAGCGTGWWLEHLSARRELHAELHGVDLLEERVQAARRRVPSATVTVGDLRALPYGDRYFDLVFLFTCLSSMKSRKESRRGLREAGRVLADGGTLVVWEPRVPNLGNRNVTFVSRHLLSAEFGDAMRERSITVLPPLSRRLGRQAERVYPRLARLSFLRTHRLSWTPGEAEGDRARLHARL